LLLLDGGAANHRKEKRLSRWCQRREKRCTESVSKRDRPQDVSVAWAWKWRRTSHSTSHRVRVQAAGIDQPHQGGTGEVCATRGGREQGAAGW
jgi:hypothetical protein